MQAPQTWLTIPRGRSRPAAALPGTKLGTTPATRPRARFRLPTIARPRLGARMLAGLTAFLLVLLPGLLAAEIVARGYEARLAEDTRLRSTAGLDAVASLVDSERTRALNNAELAATRLGRVTQGAAPEDALKAVAELRTSLRTTLVAIVDGSGRTLASDPASNLPFGNTFEAKQAFQGKIAVVIQERTTGFAVQAAAPLRVDGEIVPGAVVVAQSLEDPFLNTSQRLTGLESALVQNNRLVAASRGIRRSFAFATDQTLDPDLTATGPDRFRRGRIGSETFYLASRTLMNGQREIGTMLVGLPADATDDAIRTTRLLGFGAALLGAVVAGLAGARLGRWQVEQANTLGLRVRALAEPAATMTSPTARPATETLWPGLDRAVEETRLGLARQRTELRGQAARLEAVLGSLAEGVIVADAQRHVIYANPVARRLLSLPASGEDDALTVLDDADDSAPLASQRVIRSYAAPVVWADGGNPGVVTVLRDATREQEVEQLKSELLSNVSHELQTPLTAIRGALDLVLEDDEGHLSRVQRRFLDTIDRNCDRLVGLVADLLDLSRLDAGRVELEPCPLDTPSVVTTCLAALGNLFERRGQTVRVDMPPDTPPILGDRRRVEQILTNLLSNAAKYTPEGGLVEISARPEGDRVAIAVTDSGPGIPEAEQELVFDKFYRGKDALRRGQAGSGLGLAIAKSLVELHGGTIRVESPSDGSGPRGARFVVELPRAADEDDALRISA